MNTKPKRRGRAWGRPLGLLLSAVVACTAGYFGCSARSESDRPGVLGTVMACTTREALRNHFSPFHEWKVEAKQAVRKLLISAVDKTLGVQGERDAPALLPAEPVRREPSEPAIPADASFKGEEAGPATVVGESQAAWQRLDAVAPEDAEAPRWVMNAAGSEPWSQDVLGVIIRGCRPGPDGEIVGYSSGYEADPAKARASARRSALDGLKAIALWKITGWKESEQGLVTDSGYVLSVAGVSSFLDGLFQRDFPGRVRAWYDQKVVIHNEPMFRSAVLVNADDARIKQVIAEAVRSGQMAQFARRYEIFWTTASAVGLALVIFLLYSFLNAGTKGHFAWPLRLFSVGTLAALYLVLLYVKGWFP